MFGQGFNSPQLHQRFEPRLKACHKTAGLGTSSLPPYLRHAPCLALRSVPLMGTEIVTRLCLDISISRHSLSAIAIPSRTPSAPYNSPQLRGASSRRSRGSIRKHLAGHDDGHPIAMIGEDAVLPRLARHDERRTFALEKGLVHRQDVQIERFHLVASVSFSAFSRTSSMPPTLKNAASG